MSPPTSDAALQRLRQGIQGFQQRYYAEQPEAMRRLVQHGQSPDTLLISCSDSRVDPALLTDAEPGELFVVRNVANLVPPYAHDGRYNGMGAAIEYAVRDLKVHHIIVLGHAHCGGIKALLNTVAGQKPAREFIADWVSLAEDACCHYVSDHSAGIDAAAGGRLKEVSLESLQQYPYLVERAAIQGSLDNLLTYPWLRERVEAGDLSLHGWWFDLESGDLWTTDGDHRDFLPVVD